jgi:hypothetical protein
MRNEKTAYLISQAFKGVDKGSTHPTWQTRNDGDTEAAATTQLTQQLHSWAMSTKMPNDQPGI